MQVMRIPSLSPRVILDMAACPPVDDLADDRLALTASASGAIYLATRALGLGADDVVLCPAYNCGHEVEAIRRAGVRVAFYPIAQDLGFRLDDIRTLVDGNVRAVLVTHFFGVGVPLGDLAAFCKANSLFLIEDCAHLLPEDPGGHGRVGDVATFSLRKPLPVPDGGLLRINNPAVEVPVPAAPPSSLASLLEVSDFVRASPDAGTFSTVTHILLRWGLKAPLKLARGLRPGLGWDYAGSDSLDYPTEHLDLKMSAPARRIASRMDWRQIRSARCRNFLALLHGFPQRSDFRPLITALEKDDCPLVFPVLCEDPDRFLREANTRGTPAVAWWPSPMHTEVPWEEFEPAADLKRRVCALPVHQDIDAAHVELMLDALREMPGDFSRPQRPRH